MTEERSTSRLGKWLIGLTDIPVIGSERLPQIVQNWKLSTRIHKLRSIGRLVLSFIQNPQVKDWLRPAIAGVSGLQESVS